ncbi:amino acid transporter [Polychaeton citri CBS 116435]|uniref:Amino acid transporter n=1 Tax=Polychaeton citri CBS 116435 TaxID=1314669 RepID=A0A9P4UU55_9PEZI|nr:amino acid transporter [Polychaeton citri CBS 116435]
MDGAKEGHLDPTVSVDELDARGEYDDKQGTNFDIRDMSRMGKKQVLRREFQFFSIWGYAVILGASWEYALISGVLSLPNGGTAGAVWMFLAACSGMFFVTLSMAEMASIAPTAGGQYHWVSEMAPPKYQKLLSYCVGFLCVLGWQTGMSSVPYVAAQLIEALCILGNPGYSIEPWQTTLMSWAITIFAIFCNTVLFRKLPLIEGFFMVLHVFGFFAYVVVLWVMAPRSDASVLTTFSNSNGWSSDGFATLIGISGAIVAIIGADSSVHLSEELREASLILPRSMIANALTSYILGFIMLITLVFCIGNVDAAVNSTTGQPFVEVLLNATQSKPATIAMVVLMLLLIVACAVNNVTASSRQLWSFARDGGLPFSNWLSMVRPGWDIPLNSMAVTLGFSVVLSTIAIGSNTAFAMLTTLTLTGLLSSYIICIACSLHRRLSSQPFPRSRFELGRLGVPINIIALCFLALGWTMMFFPSAPVSSPIDMNWSVVIFFAVIIFFSAFYMLKAKHTYSGPVVHVRKDM